MHSYWKEKRNETSTGTLKLDKRNFVRYLGQEGVDRNKAIKEWNKAIHDRKKRKAEWKVIKIGSEFFVEVNKPIEDTNVNAQGERLEATRRSKRRGLGAIRAIQGGKMALSLQKRELMKKRGRAFDADDDSEHVILSEADATDVGDDNEGGESEDEDTSQEDEGEEGGEEERPLEKDEPEDDEEDNEGGESDEDEEEEEEEETSEEEEEPQKEKPRPSEKKPGCSPGRTGASSRASTAISPKTEAPSAMKKKKSHRIFGKGGRFRKPAQTLESVVKEAKKMNAQQLNHVINQTSDLLKLPEEVAIFQVYARAFVDRQFQGFTVVPEFRWSIFG